ncbi:hypothetical protein M9Y10_023820 [Tritrichomonas musculus]|uniref:Serine/threonine-protein phosphatase n=1 Tax=Tritrichomonas musculus TaxID=1915356 RepID=A0ABR2KW64_9EUKA
MTLNQKETQLFENFSSCILENYSKSQTKNSEINFDLNTSLKIIKKVTKILKKEPNILHLASNPRKSDFVIVGDIHGSINSLIRIFSCQGDPSKTQYLFLGDYVDRGSNSCEVIILLYTFKCLYPDNIYLIRGNHEFEDMTHQNGFEEECLNRIQPKKEGKKFYQNIIKTFRFLPICSILNDKFFCVHGGISSSIKDRSQLSYAHKVGPLLSSSDNVQIDFFWSDPSNLTLEYDENPNRHHMDFHIFGKNALKKFLHNNHFDLVIRAHEYTKDGYNWPFGINGGILTVFSSLNYCNLSNNAAIVLISDDDKIDIMKIKEA